MSRLLDNVTHRAVWAAAKRWPQAERDEAIAEWTAELHMLADHPGKAFRYAVSLAVGRPDGGFTWPTAVRSAAALAAGPVLGLVATVALSVLVQVSLGGGGVTAEPDQYGGACLLATMTPLGYAAWQLGQRRSAGAPFAGLASLAWVVGILLVTDLTIVTVSRLLSGPSLTIRPGVLEAGGLVWAAVFGLAGWAVLRLRRGPAVIAAMVGGLAAWIAAFTVVVLLQTDASDIPREGAYLWWLIPLVDPTGHSPASFEIRDNLATLATFLVPATVFGLAYLAGGSREPRPDHADAVLAGR